MLQKLSIEAACPLPAAVTGGSIGRHARRNYGGPGIRKAHRNGRCGRFMGVPPSNRTGRESVAAVGRLRKRRRPDERLRRAGALRIELLGFERQPGPGPGHVGQNGAHPQGRRALSHLPAFDGALSALDRSNHRHPAERSQIFIGTIQQLQSLFSLWPPAPWNYLQTLSRLSDKRRGSKVPLRWNRFTPRQPRKSSTETPEPDVNLQRPAIRNLQAHHIGRSVFNQTRRHDGCTLEGKEPADLWDGRALGS